MSPTPLPLSGRTVTVVGGDLRMLYAAHRLGALGARVRTLGVGDASQGGFCPFQDLSDAARDADALLLPLPVTRDGVTVNCPCFPTCQITLDELAALLRSDSHLLLFG